MSSCSSNLTEHSSYDYMYILETALYTDAVVGTWTAETRSRDTPLTMLISISWLVLNLTSTQGHACLLTVERHHRLRPHMSLVTVTGYPRDGLIR